MELEPWKLYLLPYGKNSSLSRFLVLKKIVYIRMDKSPQKGDTNED